MNTDLENIKSRLNIVDIIGQYLRLEKAGTNWRANCPFHNEKTPSFMVSEEKQIFHCFGCQKGGDIFTFVMEMEGMEFREALQILADKAGIQLQKFEANPKKQEEKNRTLEILELATKFFEHCLLNSAGGKKSLEYLKERGLQEETIKKFRLGYAPNGWRNILNFLTAKGYSEKEIEKTGLLVKKDAGKIYDRFRARIMFPIAESQGKIVGFSARVAPGQDESQAKYVNTPETEVYHKSKILFGLDKAKTAIKQKDWVLLVEGNMDVIASHQAGLENVVAVSGTALTSEQVKIIKRYTRNIKMFFDMDEAGDQATRKSLKLCFEEGISPSIVSFSEGKDAADIVRENSALFISRLEKSQEALDHLFQKAFSQYDAKNPKEKKIIAEDLLEMIAYLESDLEKDHWIKVLAEKLNTEERILTEMLKKASLRSSDYVSSEKEPVEKEKLDRQGAILNKIMGISLVHSEAWKKVLATEDIREMFSGRLADQFKRGAEMNFDFTNFFDQLEDRADKQRAENLFMEEKYQLGLAGEPEEKSAQDYDQQIENYFRELRIENKQKELSQIAKDLKVAQENQDKETEKFLIKESQKIAQELFKLSNAI